MGSLSRDARLGRDDIGVTVHLAGFDKLRILIARAQGIPDDNKSRKIGLLLAIKRDTNENPRKIAMETHFRAMGILSSP